MINQEILSKSIVLKKNVKKGEILDERNLTLKLPSKGINAKQWYNVIGKEASKDLSEGDYLFTCDMLEQESERKQFLKKVVKKIEDLFPEKLGLLHD